MLRLWHEPLAYLSRLDLHTATFYRSFAFSIRAVSGREAINATGNVSVSLTDSLPYAHYYYYYYYDRPHYSPRSWGLSSVHRSRACSWKCLFATAVGLKTCFVRSSLFLRLVFVHIEA